MVLNIFVILFCGFSNALPATLEASALANLKPINAEQVNQIPDSGKDKLIYFWATWCPDCKEKLTSFFKNDELYKKFDVLLVATDKEKSKVEHFLKKNEIKPHVIIDETREFQKQLGVFSVPTFVRLKKQNDKYTIVHKQSGGSLDELVKE